MKRVPSSRRVTAFYKIQCYDLISMAWRDVPGRHPTLEIAQAACPDETKYRVTEVAVRYGRRVDLPR